MSNAEGKPLLLDAFLFYNELDLLKARLEYLGNTVDYFVISEANIDFSGKKKAFLLSDELISTLPFAEKIIYHREYIHLSSIEWLIKRLRYQNRKNRLLWKIQDAQRNSTLKPLSRFKASDIVIFSDLDEFPNEKALKETITLLSKPEALKANYALVVTNSFSTTTLKMLLQKISFMGQSLRT